MLAMKYFMRNFSISHRTICIQRTSCHFEGLDWSIFSSRKFVDISGFPKSRMRGILWK